MNKKEVFPQRSFVPAMIHTDKEELPNAVESEITLSSNGFEYRYIPNWAHWPDELWGYAVSGLAVSAGGLLYASLRCRESPIAVFDLEGNYIRSLGMGLPVAKLHGLFAAADDTIWVADDTNHLIFHLDRDGKLLGELGKLHTPSDTGYDGEYVDPEDKVPYRMIKIVGEDGKLHCVRASNTAYKSILRAGGPFNKPTRLIQLKDGRCFVSDGYGNAAIHSFDREGRLIKTWGGPGSGAGQFAIPHSLWADRYDRIWVSDRENERIQVFDTEGNLLKIIDGLFFVCDIWTDDEYAYVFEGEGRISIFDMDFALKAQIGHWQCTNLTAHSMTGDREGNLYLADFGIKNIFKLERVRS